MSERGGQCAERRGREKRAMSLRLLFALLGLAFGVIWAVESIGWAVAVLLCALIGYYIGAVLESGVALSALLAPLRRPR